MDLIGVVRAGPVIDGRECHTAFERNRLHSCDGIHFYGNTEHTAGKASDQSAFHTVFEIFNQKGCRICAFGAQGKDFRQGIGLKLIIISIHIVLHSAAGRLNYIVTILPHKKELCNLFWKIL